MQEINGRYKIRIPCPDGRGDCGVCHYAFIPIDAFNQIHDRYYDTYGRTPTETIVAQIYPQVRQDDKIRDLANKWGWDDTDVRESISDWMKQRIVVFYN